MWSMFVKRLGVCAAPGSMMVGRGDHEGKDMQVAI